MAARDNAPTIIIKRPRKSIAAGHGGAWKIAYADFVTAMMAFFLVLWLLSSTTEEQRKGISDFFNVIASSNSGSNGLLEGRVIDEADRQTAINPSGFQPIVLMPQPGTGGAGRPLGSELERNSPDSATGEAKAGTDSREIEEANFARIEQQLKEALREVPDLADNLLIERTPDGLRIQLVDQERSPMFASGSSVLAPGMERLLRLVAEMVARVPNRIAVGGHTDAHPFQRGIYSNWELSADRANAARRVLVGAGVPDMRIVRVLGLADRQPLIPEDPQAASNRRISILLMWMNSAEEGA
jgi:chemotaxis protein MotB